MSQASAVRHVGAVCALAGLVLSCQLQAHHSTAAYDTSRTVTLQGKVKDFQWTNPHSYIDLLVVDASGNSVSWAIECGAPNLNVRNGWKRNDLKAGDSITAVVFPMRDGTLHGTLNTVTLPDGRVLKGAANFLSTQLGLPTGPASSPSPPAAK